MGSESNVTDISIVINDCLYLYTCLKILDVAVSSFC